MPRSVSRLVVVLVAASIALGAASAAAVPFTGTLAFNFNDVIFVSMIGAGEFDSEPGTLSLTSGGVLGTAFSPVGLISPSIFPIVNFEVDGPAGIASGTFRAGGGPDGGFGGAAPLMGQARAGLFGSAFNDFAGITLPLSIVGNPGATGVTSSPLGIRLSAFGNAWTTGVARVFTTGGVVPLVSSAGFDGRTAMGAGQISLVTPTLVRSNIGGFEEIGLVTRLTLSTGGIPHPGGPDPDPGNGGPSAAVPEPGALWIFGAGWLAVAGATRRRR